MNYSRHCYFKLSVSTLKNARSTSRLLTTTAPPITAKCSVAVPWSCWKPTLVPAVSTLDKKRFGTTSTLLKIVGKEQEQPEQDHQQNENADSNHEVPLTDYENADEHVTLRLTTEELQELTNNDEELIKKVKFIQMEHELLRQDGARVPFRPIKLKRWKELLELGSRFQRKKFFAYVWDTQVKEDGDIRKKAEKRAQKQAEFAEKGGIPLPEEDPYSMHYGLGRNSIRLRLYDSTINAFFHSRVITEMIHGQPLILDFGYDEFMNRREAKNCAAQIEYFLSDNRQHPQLPMNIYLCNVNRQGVTYQTLRERIPIIEDDNYALNIMEQSYLDLFPKEKLVYLTPHSRNDLLEFNDEEIYIIGAMVDKSDPRPFSLAKAKREGLRMKKLPLDLYFEWGLGGKSLTINQIGNIMLDFYNTRDWKQSLRHVPTRKIRREDEFNPSDRFILQKGRKERASAVVADYELMNSRRGFGFKGGKSKLSDENQRDSFRPNMKSILRDEDEH